MRGMLDVTPERCKTAQRTLKDEARRYGARRRSQRPCTALRRRL